MFMDSPEAILLHSQKLLPKIGKPTTVAEPARRPVCSVYDMNEGLCKEAFIVETNVDQFRIRKCELNRFCSLKLGKL